MEYHFLDTGNHIWKDAKKVQWRCCSQKQYPVLGDVHSKATHQTDKWLVSGQERLAIEPFKRRLGYFEKVHGYLECESSTGERFCVRVVLLHQVKISSLIVMALALLLAGGYGIYSLKPAPKQPVKELKAFEAPDGLENNDSHKIVLPAYEQLVVDAKTNRLQTPLINVAGNQCRMAYKLIAKKTGKVLFSSRSQRLKPGSAWYNFELDRKLSKGSYPIKIEVTNYALTGQHKLNSSSLESTLIVE